jgi:nitroreductase
MDFFEAVSRRRSVRNYSSKLVPNDVIERALDAALIAPNSSNMQTWRIFWVRDPGKKAALVEACLSQGAAKTAQELLVFTADGSQWRRSQKYLLDSIKDNPRKDLHDYYGKLIPVIYGYQWLSPLKWVLFHLIGLFKPMVRADSSRRETAVKSAALACENFMLAIAAQGFDTCPMEGFDSVRVRKLIGFPRSTTVVMVISVGERTERGIWGERFRIPRSEVVHQI